MATKSLLQLQFLLVLHTLQQFPVIVSATDDFTYTKGPIPTSFNIGEHYPDRNEEFQCRSIKFHVQPDSQKYRELVTYNGNNIRFTNSSSHRMTSRMQTRLQALANDYYQLYNLSLYVLKAWSSFPDSDIEDNSLHYEGKVMQMSI